MDSHRPALRPESGAPVRPRLWRSAENKVLAGVVGGLAERLDVNPTALRWFVALGTCFSGVVPGVVLYVLLWSIARPHADPPRRVPSA